MDKQQHGTLPATPHHSEGEFITISYCGNGEEEEDDSGYQSFPFLATPEQSHHQQLHEHFFLREGPATMKCFITDMRMATMTDAITLVRLPSLSGALSKLQNLQKRCKESICKSRFIQGLADEAVVTPSLSALVASNHKAPGASYPPSMATAASASKPTTLCNDDDATTVAAVLREHNRNTTVRTTTTRRFMKREGLRRQHKAMIAEKRDILVELAPLPRPASSTIARVTKQDEECLLEEGCFECISKDELLVFDNDCVEIHHQQNAENIRPALSLRRV